MKVFVVISEHPTQSPTRVDVFAKRERAEAHRAEMVGIMLKDCKPGWFGGNTDAQIAALQDEYGAANCCCEIIEREVQS